MSLCSYSFYVSSIIETSLFPRLSDLNGVRKKYCRLGKVPSFVH